MDLKDLDDQEKKWKMVVSKYEDFRKIVCAYIKHAYPKATDDYVEELIKKGGGEGIIQAMYSENKKNFAKGMYVCSKAAAAAMNLD